MVDFEDATKLPPWLHKADGAPVDVLDPTGNGNNISYVIRRRLAAADEGDEVWDSWSALGPLSDQTYIEAMFQSVSDPEVQALYGEGEAEFDRSGQMVELRFSAPRFIGLGALADGFNITVDESGDGSGNMIGRALIWAGLQLLRRPAEAAVVQRTAGFVVRATP